MTGYLQKGRLAHDTFEMNRVGYLQEWQDGFEHVVQTAMMCFPVTRAVLAATRTHIVSSVVRQHSPSDYAKSLENI